MHLKGDSSLQRHCHVDLPQKTARHYHIDGKKQTERTTYDIRYIRTKQQQCWPEKIRVKHPSPLSNRPRKNRREQGGMLVCSHSHFWFCSRGLKKKQKKRSDYDGFAEASRDANYAAFIFPTPTPNNSQDQSLNEQTPMRPYLPTSFLELGCFAKNVV